MAAQLLITNVNVLTMAQQHGPRRPMAIAVDRGRIQAVGSAEELVPLAQAQTQVMDLGGRTVLPGFIDSHVHFTQTGLGSLGPNLYGVTRHSDVMQRVAASIDAAGPGTPRLIHGCAFGELDAPVTRGDLDRIAPAAPLMIGDIGAHACVINTAAASLLGLAPTAEVGQVLSGSANTRARYQFYTRCIDDEMRLKALHRAAQLALQAGITTVHALEGGSPDGRGWLPQRDAEVLLREQAGLPCRTVLYFQSTDVGLAKGWGLPRIGGCIWVDGSYFERTAALQEPYVNGDGHCGCLYFSQQSLDAFVLQAHDAGMQVSLHAIGDAAIEQVIRAYEHALRHSPRSDHRHRIEHFSLPTSRQIERVATLGIAVAMQPNFATHPPAPGADGEHVAAPLERLLGPERYGRRHPYRRIIDSGVLVAGGSDAEPKPMGPLIGVGLLASHPENERRLSVLEALSLYTRNAARVGFEEADKGSIEPGKLADLVVLARDPLTEAPSRICGIEVDLTLVGGQVAYRRESLELSACG